jgi:drug/metabolite transporter, DME family
MTSPSLAPQRSYLAGCALVVLAGLVLSLGIVCVRGAATSDAWQYLFWRALGFGIVLTIVAAYRHRINPVTQVRRLGGFGWLSVLAMVGSQICFIAAIKSGSTAEVFFLMSLAPLMAAVLARPLLGERIGMLGLFAIVVALAGVALMSGLSVAGDGLHSGLWEGNWVPRVLALGTALTFALYSIATRGARPEDLDAALVAVGAVTAIVCAIVVVSLDIAFTSTLRDAALGLLHGGVILAIGLVLFARGSRVVPGVTLVMLAQAETVAAPVWTYLIFNETTTLAVIAGGALILVAVVMQAMDGQGKSAARS